jgi:hypothetical protein
MQHILTSLLLFFVDAECTFTKTFEDKVVKGQYPETWTHTALKNGQHDFVVTDGGKKFMEINLRMFKRGKTSTEGTSWVEIPRENIVKESRLLDQTVNIGGRRAQKTLLEITHKEDSRAVTDHLWMYWIPLDREKMNTMEVFVKMRLPGDATADEKLDCFVQSLVVK